MVKDMDLTQPLPYIGISLIKIIWSVVAFIVGWIVAKIIVSIFRKGLDKTTLPEILKDFLSNAIYALLLVAVLLIAVSLLGVNVGSVVIGLSAVIGLVLGFGLQDTMTNLAAGFWIALMRPFDKEDVITTNGLTGKVSNIGVMSTELITPDNKVIFISNKDIWGSPIINYTRQPIRRVDVNVGVAYGTKLDEAIQIAIDFMKNHPLVLNDPSPAVVITELADSSINLQLRAWVKTEDYWTVMNDLLKGIYEVYTEKGIEIPFPQLDVHLKQ
ncbi:MAG: mechanosensitive ion channel family protein [Methanococci archaeon]|nr:mechanosensitive ion channel family protein [Methanococci archaeon]